MVEFSPGAGHGKCLQFGTLLTRCSIAHGAGEVKLGFIGAGKMATAIARGAVKADLCTPAELIGSARAESTRAAF